MREPLERLFLREKPVLAILAVGEIEHAYAALVAKRIDSTFPHTCSIFRELEAQGLIKSRPEGRINYLELTARGKSVVKALQGLSELLQRPDAMRQRLERLRQLACHVETKRDFTPGTLAPGSGKAQEPGKRTAGEGCRRTGYDDCIHCVQIIRFIF